jgi:hypothetical protein
MTKVILSIGSVASRVASPNMSSTGQVNSTEAASVVASSGGSSGTLYSSRNSTMVVCQLASLVRPIPKHRSNADAEEELEDCQWEALEPGEQRKQVFLPAGASEGGNGMVGH